MHIRALLVMSRQRRLSTLEQLEACSAEVVTADDCQEARAALAYLPLEVVLSDAQLPDGDWTQVREALSANGKRTPLVVCASRTEARPGLWTEIVQGGAFDLLVEPYLPEEFERVLRSAASRAYMRTLGAPA